MGKKEFPVSRELAKKLASGEISVTILRVWSAEKQRYYSQVRFSGGR